MNLRMKWKRYKEYKRLNGDMCGWYADMAENPDKHNTIEDRHRVLQRICPNGEILIWDEKENHQVTIIPL